MSNRIEAAAGTDATAAEKKARKAKKRAAGKDRAKAKPQAKKAVPTPSPLRQKLDAYFKKSKYHLMQPSRLPQSEVDRLRAETTPAAADDGNRRIVVFMPDSVQVFRFLHTGSFDRLLETYDATVVVPPADSKFAIKVPLDVPPERVRHLDVDRARYNAWETVFHVSCRAMSKASSSFRIRHHMDRLALAGRPANFWNCRDDMLLRLRALPGLFGRFRQSEVERLGAEPAMARLMAEVKPRFVVLASSLYDCFTNDATVTAKLLGIPTVVLQTGWDNPSSKGTIALEPDHFGVWSEQSARHVRDMQNVDEKRIFIIGSPYYEPFFRREPVSRSEARRRLGLPDDGPIVMLGGSFRQFDETALLRRIEAAIDAGELPRMTVFYRPHPGRQLREEENFFEIGWKYTMLDPEVEDVYRSNLERKKAIRDAYNLDRVADLLTAVDVTVSPLSSITLESLIVGTPVLAICYNDGKNAWGPDKTAQMEHYKDMERVDVVRMCRSGDTFMNDLRTMLAVAADPATAAKAREGARYFVDNGERPYGERLVDVIEQRVYGRR